MRLDKLLEKAKVGSRGEVKKLLRSRQVRVDGHIVTKANLNVDSHLQEITVSGRAVQIEGESYLMLHKPAGVVSAVRDEKQSDRHWPDSTTRPKRRALSDWSLRP